MDGLELLRFLGFDVQAFLVSVLTLAIVLAIVFMVRVTRIEFLYQRYKYQFEIIERYAPDVIIRIAFPNVDDAQLEKELERYQELAEIRQQSGLSWIDPRMLYAIDEVEKALPEQYALDFNIVLDKMERIYQKLKADGLV